ncbi:MAG: CD225/dispanin family protein [Bacteroidales bacterium]|nr:CD225/dispanin family protein [Bacteroidales bacterium]MBQ8461724.1 CD225/dispanin family protein [Bacteroidales bacterium]
MKPNTNLVWAILTTLFCCLPFGIVSIVYAAKVDSLWYAGNYAAAQDASKKAGTWAIVSAASAVGIWIIYLIVAVCIAGAAFSLVPFANL